MNEQLNYNSTLYIPGVDHAENILTFIVCCVAAGETTCPQICSIGAAVVPSPVYTAVA
jgi:hypothetical protein